jgi:hypothetical protein
MPNSESSLIQKSIEVAAEDIATEIPERWSWWVLYLIVALKNKGAPGFSFQGFLKRLVGDIGQHLEKV